MMDHQSGGTCRETGVGEGDEEVQASSYKLSQSQGCNVRSREYNRYCNNLV